MKRRVSRFWIVLMISLVLVIFVVLLTGRMEEAGFSVLSDYRKARTGSLDLTAWEKISSRKLDHSDWDELLKKNVSSSGEVNYDGFEKDRKSLESYLNKLSQNPPSTNWTENEQLAYWINAYNAFTIKLVLDHYPLVSIRDIGGSIPLVNDTWEIEFFQIGGVDFTLNRIEQDIIREQFEDPRFHFALNCASVSCPKLRNEAYAADKLEMQLDDQTRYFINLSEKNLLSEYRIRISKVFSWYRSDFTKEGTLIEYLNRYSSTKISENANVSFNEYDWGLNEIQSGN